MKGKILVAAALLSVLLTVTGSAYAATWWDSDWAYRTNVNVTIPAVGLYKNRFTSFSLDARTLQQAGKLKGDFSDLRLVFENGTEISRKILKNPMSNNVSVWFNYTSNEGALYAYYGNPTASVPTDYNITNWAIGDDFDKSTLNIKPDNTEYFIRNNLGANDIVTNIWFSGGSPSGNKSWYNKDVNSVNPAMLFKKDIGHVKMFADFYSLTGGSDGLMLIDARTGTNGVYGTRDTATLWWGSLYCDSVNSVCYEKAGGGTTNWFYLYPKANMSITAGWNIATKMTNYTIYNSTFSQSLVNEGWVGTTGAGVDGIAFFAGYGAQEVFWDNLIIVEITGQPWDEPPFMTGAEEDNVPPIATSMTLLLNGTSANTAITYGAATNMTAVMNVSDLKIDLDINGTERATANNKLEQITNIDWFNGGTVYEIKAEWDGNGTHLGSSATYYLTVNKDTITLTNELNSTAGDKTYTFPQAVNATAAKPIASGTLNYERNGTASSNPFMDILGVGAHNFTASLTHENYTAVPVTRMATVQARYFLVSISSSQGWTIGENTETVITASDNATSSVFYRDGVAITSPYTAVLPFGTYNFTVDIGDYVNSTASLRSKFLSVSSGGFGCTNPVTFAFYRNVTGGSMSTLNFTELVANGMVRKDFADIRVTSDSLIDIFRNYTAGRNTYYLVVNASNVSSYRADFGNYIGNFTGKVNTTNATGLMYGHDPMASYVEQNPYYVISFINEITGNYEMPPSANTTLSVYCANGVSSFGVADSTIFVATFSSAEEMKATVTYSATEVYYRTLLFSAPVEYRSFYLADAVQNQVAQMLMSVSDVTGSFTSGSVVRIMKYLEGSLRTITEGRLDAENKVIMYLINGDRYQVYIDNGVQERSIGFLYVDPTDLSKTIVITSGLKGATQGAYNVTYSMGLLDGVAYFVYTDSLGLTNNVSFYVYDYPADSLLYFGSSLNRSYVSFSYAVPDPNATYRIGAEIDRDTYTFTSMFNLFSGLYVYSGELPTAISFIPSGYLLGISLAIIISVPMLFGGIFGAAGGLVAVAVAVMLAYFGMYQTSLLVVGIAGTFALLNALTKNRKVEG